MNRSLAPLRDTLEIPLHFVNGLGQEHALQVLVRELVQRQEVVSDTDGVVRVLIR